MKTGILIVLIFVNFKVIAGNLNCSANGTFIYHIPGAFTSQNDQTLSKNSAKAILATILNSESDKNYFDLTKQESDVIPIAAQGYTQSKLNYLNLSLGDGYGDMAWYAMGITEYGFKLVRAYQGFQNGVQPIAKYASSNSIGIVGNAKSINQSGILSYLRSTSTLSGQGVRAINASQSNKPIEQTLMSGETGAGVAGKLFATTGLFALIGTAGSGGAIIVPGIAVVLASKGVLDFLSLLILEENFNKALNQDKDIISSFYLTQDKINKIAKIFKSKLDLNKKLIINAHGEGNQLALRAIASLGNDPRISKYISVLATSPTTGQYIAKYRTMLNSYDKRIFGGFFETPNYVIKPNLKDPNSWENFIAQVSLNSGSASNFLNFYLSPVTQGSKITYDDNNNKLPNTNFKSMRDNFIDELRSSAESLESNCVKAVINYTADNHVINFDSTDPDDLYVSGLTYSWNFGDGQNTSTFIKKLSHTYSKPGTYNVVLTVSDAYGASSIAKASITIAPGPTSLVRFCNAGLIPGTMNVDLYEYGKFSIDHIFPASGNNADPHTCGCKTVVLPAGDTIPVTVTGGGQYLTEVYTFKPLTTSILITGETQYFSIWNITANGVDVEVADVTPGIFAANRCSDVYTYPY